MQVQRSTPNERECASLLRLVRWPHGPTCPCCLSGAVIRSGKHLGRYRRYKCKACARIFNDKTGTIFEDSKMPLKVWFVAALLQRKMSIRQVSSALDMYYDTTHRMVGKLRRSAYPDLISVNLKNRSLHDTSTASSQEAGVFLRQVLRDMKTAG